MTDPIRILFIDDEANILRALERVFFDEEYEILTARSASEALEILSRISPVQVVVSDYRMPQMNGVELLRRVRDSWPETVRTVISGYADTEAIVSAINDGQIYRFIPKPWNDMELRMTIAAAVNQYKRQRKEILYAESMQKKIDALERENSFLVQRVEGPGDCIAPQEILDNLPTGVVLLNGKREIVQCNREARSLLQEAAGNEKCDSLDLDVSKDLNALLENISSQCGRGKHLDFGNIPVLVHTAYLETRSSDRFLVAVLARETTDD